MSSVTKTAEEAVAAAVAENTARLIRALRVLLLSKGHSHSMGGFDALENTLEDRYGETWATFAEPESNSLEEFVSLGRS